MQPQPKSFPMFAYTAFPFSVLAERMGQTTMISDVGLITSVTTNNNKDNQNYDTACVLLVLLLQSLASYSTQQDMQIEQL